MFDRFYYYASNEAPDGTYANPGASTAIARLDAAASSAQSTTQAYTVSAGTDRCLIVGVQYEAADDVSAVTVTYGGQSMTSTVYTYQFDGGGGGSNQAVHLFRLMETGIAAAGSTTISVSGVADANDMSIHAASYENVHQASPSAGTDTDSVNASTPNPLNACDITVPANGAGVALAGSGSLATATWTNLTEQTEESYGTTTAGSLADTLTAGATSVDCTWSAQTRAAIVAVALNPAA